MINIIFSTNMFLGIYCSIFGIIVYCIRYVTPEISRDEDIIFSTICLFYGAILIFHGWRLDPILLFSQMLIIIIMTAAKWENIRLRGFIESQENNRQ